MAAGTLNQFNTTPVAKDDKINTNKASDKVLRPIVLRVCQKKMPFKINTSHEKERCTKNSCPNSAIQLFLGRDAAKLSIASLTSVPRKIWTKSTEIQNKRNPRRVSFA